MGVTSITEQEEVFHRVKEVSIVIIRCCVGMKQCSAVLQLVVIDL
jgi:hypothetical protein